MQCQLWLGFTLYISKSSVWNCLYTTDSLSLSSGLSMTNNHAKGGRGVELWDLLRKHDTSIDEDIAVTVPNKHAVHPNFTQPTNGKNPEGWPIWTFIKLLHLAFNRVLHAFSRTFYSSWSFAQYSISISIYTKQTVYKL